MARQAITIQSGEWPMTIRDMPQTGGGGGGRGAGKVVLLLVLNNVSTLPSCRPRRRCEWPDESFGWIKFPFTLVHKSVEINLSRKEEEEEQERFPFHPLTIIIIAMWMTKWTCCKWEKWPSVDAWMKQQQQQQPTHTIFEIQFGLRWDGRSVSQIEGKIPIKNNSSPHRAPPPPTTRKGACESFGNG